MRPDTTLSTLEDLEQEAAALAGMLVPKMDTATLVTLSGDLGAGKTTFTQALARALSITDSVTSPTFVLAKSYDLPDGLFKKLVHIDAYRLEEGKDLAALDFAHSMEEPGTLVVLEWPEMVIDGLPKADVAITLTLMPGEARTLTYA